MATSRDNSDLDYGVRGGEVTPCVLLLDLSNSMNDPVAGTKTTRIEELNKGLQALRDSLNNNIEAQRRVVVAMVTVGGREHPQSAWLVHDFKRVNKFEPPVFEADGDTRLGSGVLRALDILETRRDLMKHKSIAFTRPWLFILSDGEPTDLDVWPQAVQRARDAQNKRKCLIVPFLIEGVACPKLDDLTGEKVPTLRAADFELFFRWVTASVSTNAVTTPRPSSPQGAPGGVPGFEAKSVWEDWRKYQQMHAGSQAFR